jgi:hypothetical protein
MHCFGCNKGVAPHLIRWPISLNAEQHHVLKYVLRHLISEYERAQISDDYYMDNEGKVHELPIKGVLELKLMKNARDKLRSSVSGKILVDAYTYAVLAHVCEVYIRAKEPADHLEEWSKTVDVLTTIRERMDRLHLQSEKPLCYQCVGDGIPIRKDE